MMKIVIFGASGPTGRLLAAQAVSEGHVVTAVTRRPDAFHLPGVRVIGGDVTESVDDAVAGQDAVLSALGAPYGRKPISVYSRGTANIIAAMHRAGVRRLVVVSSSATDPADRGFDTGGGLAFEKVLKPIITTTLGKTLYLDMERMEHLVRASDLEWTIVRPAGLFSAPGVTDYDVAETHIRGRFTSRADLADLMLRCLDDDRWVRRAVAIATRAGQPSVRQLILQEAFGKK
jgi:putative NADH-flavin reductase